MGKCSPVGERCPTNSGYTVAFKAQRHGHNSVEVASLTPGQEGS